MFIYSSLLSLFGQATMIIFSLWADGGYQEFVNDETLLYTRFIASMVGLVALVVVIYAWVV